MIDEPLVIPFSPGAALVRLAQIEGVLQRHSDIARAFSSEATSRGSFEASDQANDRAETLELGHSLQEARQNLMQAIISGEHAVVATTFAAAQQRLLTCYEAACEPIRWEGSALTQAEALSLLGFSNPQQRRESLVDAVDTRSILVTYSKPQRQVLTTIAFNDAAGATAYWLNETRVVAGEDYEDALIENYAPVFARVRLPIGPHRLRIESRNPHARAVSPEFTIEVPNL
ncbi:MAG: hypothetical protein JWN98_2760 [Abditibacteriota bacterium]|nr:hypothetical protein [Abditibacteriota bacterium]